MSSELRTRYPVDDEIDRLVVVACNDEFGGRAFVIDDTMDDVGSRLVEALVKTAGWVDDGDQVYAPDIKRATAAIGNIGLQCRLMSEANGDGEVPGELYGEAVLNHQHPVGVDNVELMLHDLGSDHLPALAICGEGLFDLLLPWGSVDVVRIGSYYDFFTSAISDDIASYINRQKNYRDRMSDGEVFRDGVFSGAWFSEREVEIRNAKIEQLAKDGLERLELI